MRERTIDLRHPDQAHSARRPGALSQHQNQGQNTPVHTVNQNGKSEQSKALIAWSALEYEAHERRQYWFLWPAGAALTLVILGILIQNYFFVAFIALAFVVVIMYARRPPREIQFAVSHEGVLVGHTLHRFSDMKSFCIFDAAEPYELSLEIDRITMPYLRLPLGDTHPNRIRAVLSDFLPEEKHKEFVSDQIARGLGF